MQIRKEIGVSELLEKVTEDGTQSPRGIIDQA